jgi:hypothetical protein
MCPGPIFCCFFIPEKLVDLYVGETTLVDLCMKKDLFHGTFLLERWLEN